LWVTWIIGVVLHRLVVAVMFENELLVIDLDAAEIVLLVRIVVLSRPPERKGVTALVRYLLRLLTLRQARRLLAFLATRNW